MTHIPIQCKTNFSQHFLLTTISNSSNHNFELNHDYELAYSSMLIVIINPGFYNSVWFNSCSGTLSICELSTERLCSQLYSLSLGYLTLSSILRRDQILRLRARRSDAVRLQERPIHRQRRSRGRKAAGSCQLSYYETETF